MCVFESCLTPALAFRQKLVCKYLVDFVLLISSSWCDTWDGRVEKSYYKKDSLVTGEFLTKGLKLQGWFLFLTCNLSINIFVASKVSSFTQMNTASFKNWLFKLKLSAILAVLKNSNYSRKEFLFFLEAWGPSL